MGNVGETKGKIWKKHNLQTALQSHKNSGAQHTILQKLKNNGAQQFHVIIRSCMGFNLYYDPTNTQYAIKCNIYWFPNNYTYLVTALISITS